MTTPTPLRIGIVGVGFGAVVHIPGFQSEGWDVRAAWSRRTERAREAAEKYGVPDVVEDWRELVERDDLDAVAVVTPTVAHHEVTKAALEAGKHVLCEKPFAINVRQAEEMRDLAAARGLTAMLAHEFRWSSQRAHVKELLEQGYIGTPQLVSMEIFMGRPASVPPPPLGASRAEGAGFLGGLGSHYIDGLRHWFGEVAEARGMVRVLRPDRTDPKTGAIVHADADDTFAATLLFEDGVLGTMIASSAVSPAQGVRITVTGSEGVLRVDQSGGNPDEDGLVLGGKSTDAALTPIPMPPHLRAPDDDRDPRLGAFRLLVRAFEQGIRTGTSPAPNFDDGVACQRVLDAIREG